VFIFLEDRPSDSPFVERIYRCHSERAGTFHSVGASHWEMIVTRHKGKTFLTVRGPETKATTADCPADGEWVENAESFVKRLVHDGLIAADLAVAAALQGQRQGLSLRSAQRHFLQATGISHSTIRQIERARHATNLLKEGVSILDTVDEAGYYDQAHLTRSLKYLIGQTPAQIIRADKQLSFLYKTESL
jgi:AraC-like DNA-binding protein